MVAEAVIRTTLLRPNKVLEFHRITQEEHGRVVSHHVVVALAGIELQRETAGVAPGIRTASLARHGGESDQRVRFRTRLEHRRFGVGTDIMGHLEMPKCSRTFRVRLPLGNAFAIEIGHLLDEVVVM